MMLGNPLLIWGNLTSPRNRQRRWERPEPEGAHIAERLSQSAEQGPIKIVQKQLWFDLIAAGTPHKQADIPVL